MSLTPGTNLGPYRIASLLGSGGMGEVYRAKDTRLGRDVAVKILPASFAADADRRARFEREAQAIASLSHPNVVAIFDTGIQESQAYVVMELLTGQTLRQRLSGSSSPSGTAATEQASSSSARSQTAHGLAFRKALDIAIQVARGLGAAHAKGIIHRDLKPENVFLLDDGQVKILDFGLARQFGSHDTEATRTVATEPGVVMGTIGYMAPEQVRGLATDARTDVFAFGAVLYEMLSGRRAFQRDTAADTMTAILTQEPPEVSSTRVETPPALDRIVRHCLEKNASERFESARDVAFALEALSGATMSIPESRVPNATPTTTHRWRWTTIAAVFMLVGGAAGAGLAVRFQSPGSQNIVFEARTFDSQSINTARFGPDGKTIIFSAAASGAIPSLYVVRPGESASQLIAGPGTELLSVSPSGELAVLTGAKNTYGHRVYSGTLGRMSMTGAVRPWLEHVTEADWSPDGSTLAVIHVDQSTWRLEYPIGTTLYSISRGYLSDLRVSPDGARVAFFEHELMGDDRGWIKVVGRSGPGSVKTLGGDYWGEEGIAWSHDARTIYFSAADSGGQSYQVRAVDAVAATPPRRVIGAPEALEVQDMAPDGHLLIMNVTRRASLRALLPGETKERELPWLDFEDGGFLSNDGQHLVLADLSAGAGTDYAVAWRNRSDGQVVRLGPGFPMDLSPDGKWVLADIPSKGQAVLYPTGPGEPITLSRIVLASVEGTGQWMADGQHLWLCGRLDQAPTRCYRVTMQPGSTPEPVTPAGVVSGLVAKDDRTVLAVLEDGSYRVMTLGEGGLGRPARGLTGEDVLIGWGQDLKSVIVSTRNDSPARVERVDIDTGARTLLKELSPADGFGVDSVSPYTWRDDGRVYVYSYVRELCQLFSVSGVGR